MAHCVEESSTGGLSPIALRLLCRDVAPSGGRNAHGLTTGAPRAYDAGRCEETWCLSMPGTILLTVTDYAYSINRAELESE